MENETKDYDVFSCIAYLSFDINKICAAVPGGLIIGYVNYDNATQSCLFKKQQYFLIFEQYLIQFFEVVHDIMKCLGGKLVTE